MRHSAMKSSEPSAKLGFNFVAGPDCGVSSPSGSIYQSGAIENALRSAYKPEELFGLRNVEQVSSTWPRVAVTTTVESNCWLLANYNQGDSKRYLKPRIATFEA
jgi:hypothetical protein